MSCGCGAAYTEADVAAWFEKSGARDELREQVKDNPRKFQEMLNDELFATLRPSYKNSLLVMHNWSTKAHDAVKKIVDELIQEHIQAELANATPFEPIVIKQKETVSVR